MDKILFIIPPYVNYESFVNPAFNDGTMLKKTGKYRNIVADMPIGVLSLSAYLKKHTNVDIRLIDFNIILHRLESFSFNSFSDLFRSVLSESDWTGYNPNIIGISTLFTPSYHNMLELGYVARDIFPDTLMLAGGGVPTVMYNEIFESCSCFDALCFGEGEKPLLGLLGSSDKNKYLEITHSWITKKKSKGNQLFTHDFIEELDEIPFLDYGLFNMNDYRLNPILSTFLLAKEKMTSMPVITSRGCPHHCCFCASHTVHGRAMRYHSVERVIEDFKRLKEQYQSKAIVFFDDHLMSDKKRVLEILKNMKELQLTAYFPSSLALYALDRKILEALKSVGVNQLVLSVESGSDRVLKKIMHKPLDLSIVNRVISDCRNLEIASDVAILIGLPGETKQDIEDARIFLKTLDATWFRINVATPLIGSEMFDICKKNNYIKGDFIDCDYKRAVVETEDFSAEYIQEKVYSLNLELNFVENSDFRLGKYDTALKSFENTIRVKNDHAFAYYYAAKCLRMLDYDGKYKDYKTRYQKIIEESEFWRGYVNQFKLPELD